MKTTMTESDKRLLMFMFLFVIIVAISYWGIYPQVKRYRALETKIEKEEDDKKINQMKIANLGLIEMQAEEYEGKISERKDEFYQIMKSSEIDRMMTEMATANGLDIYELNFTMPSSPTDRMAYQYSELYERQLQMKADYESSESAEMETAAATTTTEASGEEGEEESEDASASTGADSGSGTAALMDQMMGAEEGGYQPNTDIYAVPVTMTVGGDIEDLEKFIDNIISIDKRVLLVGYSWGVFRDVIRRDANGNIIRNTTGNSEDGSIVSSATAAASGDATLTNDDNVQIEVITRKSLTVRLEIYMCDTASIDASVNGSTDEGTSEEGAEGGEGTDSEEGSGDAENGTTLDELDEMLEE